MNSPHAPRRALLADDDHAVRMVFGEIIQSYGFDVTYAENGERALQLFDTSEEGFDLLLTDIAMPDMDGTELIRNIRNRDQDLPIIVMTGSPDHLLIREIRAYNVRVFFKPVDFNALQTYIDQLQAPGPEAQKGRRTPPGK